MRDSPFFSTLRGRVSVAFSILMAGCASTPPPVLAPLVHPPELVHVPPPLVEPASPEPTRGKASFVASPLAYRKAAAQHLYGHNAHRIFKGKMPPLLYAIGVLQIEVDDQGRVAGLHWMRAPSQAPEVVAEIERTVHLAAPFPVPLHGSGVLYTETWLWHKSGRFQLDTLTEGQL